MKRVNERVTSEGAPLPHNPRKASNPVKQITTNVAINEAKSLPDPEDQSLMPTKHPQLLFDGSGSKAHRVHSGVKRAK